MSAAGWVALAWLCWAGSLLFGMVIIHRSIMLERRPELSLMALSSGLFAIWCVVLLQVYA